MKLPGNHFKHIWRAPFVIAAIGVCTIATARVWDNAGTDGTVTVGPTSAEGYTTLKQCADAFNAVSGGINANWVISIQGSGSPYAETASVCFGNTIAAGKAVTLKPETAANVTVNFSQAAAQPVNGGLILGMTDANTTDSFVAMNGFVLDGSNNGSTSRNLTLTNANQGTYSAHTVVAYGSASSGTIKNCNIVNNCTYDTYVNAGTFNGCVFLCGRQTATAQPINEPNDWTVFNNSLTATAGAMGSGVECNRIVTGTNTANYAISGLTVTSNTITVSQCGVHMAHNTTATVSLNWIRVNEPTVRSAATKTGAAVRAIFHDSQPGVNGLGVFTMNVTENKIDQITYAGALADTGIHAIDISNEPNSAGTKIVNVFNNMVSGFNFTGSGTGLAMVYAAFYSEGNGGTFNIYHNSFNVPAFPLIGGTATSTLWGGADQNRVGGILVVNDGPTANVKNNIVRMVQNDGRAIYKGGANAATKLASDGNVVWTNTAGTNCRVGRLNTTEYNTWADWTGTAAKDANGHNADPAATSPASWSSAAASDLHLVPTNAGASSALFGVSGLQVTTDIDGESRSAGSPIAGADEIAHATSVRDWTLFE